MIIKQGDIVKDDIQNEYKILEAIGKGGMGYVLKAERLSDGEFFAVKTLQTYIEGDDYKAILNEGKLASEIKNDNVINYIFFHDGTIFKEYGPYIIMEYADGGDLKDLIKQRLEAGSLMDESELIPLFEQIINGMIAINEKLVHRDIKPENVLIKNGILKISDFGISKVSGDSTRTHTFKGYGTLPYYAPEVFLYKTNTIQMDIYSIGILFYVLSTLQHPYKLDTAILDESEQWKKAHMFSSVIPISNINKNIGPKISSIIQKMMEKRVSDRYSNWGEIKKDLDVLEIIASSEGSSAISDMLSASNAQRTERETKRLEGEKEQARKDQLEEIILYQYGNEVITPIENFIATFNSVATHEEEKIKKFSGEIIYPNPNTYISKNGNFRLEVSLNIVSQSDSRRVEGKNDWGESFTKMIEPRLKNKKVIAWGSIEEKNQRKGVNIILCEGEDIYGEWSILENETSPITDLYGTRPHPFAFDLSELSKEVYLVGSCHVYQTKVLGVSSDVLSNYIKQFYT